jgi:hypothetical protein
MNRFKFIVTGTALGIAIVACSSGKTDTAGERSGAPKPRPVPATEPSPAAQANPSKKGSEKTAVAKVLALPFSSTAVFDKLPTGVREQAIGELRALIAQHQKAFDMPKVKTLSAEVVADLNARGTEQVAYMQEALKIQARYGVLPIPLDKALAGISFKPTIPNHLESDSTSCSATEEWHCGECRSIYLPGPTVQTCDGASWITHEYFITYDEFQCAGQCVAAEKTVATQQVHPEEFCADCRSSSGDYPVDVATSMGDWSGGTTTVANCCYNGTIRNDIIESVNWIAGCDQHADCSHDWGRCDFVEDPPTISTSVCQ